LIGSASADGIARGEGRLRNLTGYALAVLHNGLAHYDEAYAAARLASSLFPVRVAASMSSYRRHPWNPRSS
ncbi:hypothetical protein C6A85_12620, partial [Mycobacterium sp. ITM-2017-0098]